MIQEVITKEDLSQLTDKVTFQEVKDAVFSFGAFKALYLDGFPLAFFQDHWGIVRDDIHLIVKDFFRSGKILNQINATFIVLVLKYENIVSTKGFRSINLCNTMYKILSKVWLIEKNLCWIR